MYNKYVGHPSQIMGVEEHRLTGGKGDGMRLLEVRNGKGLEFTVLIDRCADISRLSHKGDNFAFMSPCGYVHPKYYDSKGMSFLKSFTAGFLTTCGLTAAGAPVIDEGEELPMHGTISNTPADSFYYEIGENEIKICAYITDAVIFGDKLLLKRELICSTLENKIQIRDTVKNTGTKVTPLMILYHINIGYPLLSENARLVIPSKSVKPRNARALEGIGTWREITPPQPNFIEQCYYHSFEKNGMASIYNPEINKGIKINFDINELNYFTQWKMLGETDYVMGLEPGNCHPDGRAVMRGDGTLQFINPGEEKIFHVDLEVMEEQKQ